MNNTPRFWNPYAVGAGIGVLSTISIFTIGKTLGTSSAFVRVIGFLESLFWPDYVANSLYFQKNFLGKPIIDWQIALVIGLFFGSALAAYWYKTCQIEAVPSIWQKNFGSSVARRSISAFVGGIIILFGARMAGGCTSGKAISSGLQLGISAWIFIMTLFAAGIVTARILYRK